MATRIIPLGGVQEIGKATLLVEHENHIFLIDAGIKFANTYTTGIKGIIPNYAYLNQEDKKVEALFITHGHEDHIGGVVYLLKQTKLKKIFAPRIAIQYLKLKIEEHKITKHVEFIEIDKKDHYFFNDKKVKADFWTAQHSIPDAFGIRLTTPDGSLLCTGDFRFDYTPIGNYTDFARLDEIGKQGLTVLMSDSTNAMRPNHSPSESDILIDIERHIKEAKKKVVVTAFASNLTRVKVIIDLAVKLNKKVVVFGRSMVQGVKIGRKLGYIDAPADTFIDKKQIASVPENKLLIITTGSQGEQLAALSSMSYGKHSTIKITKGDLILFSSSPIPGNRMVIELLINRLYKLGAIIKENGPDGYLHTSGHAYRFEHDKVFQLARPKYFLPYHGEYRMSVVHGQSAIENGVKPQNVIVPELGNVYLMENQKVSRTNEKVDYGPVYIDGNNVLNLNSTIVKERERLAESGFVAVVISIDRATNNIVGRPQLLSRGSFFVKTSTQLIEESKRISHGAALHYIKNNKNWNIPQLKNLLIERLTALYHKEKRRNPIIIPVIILLNERNKDGTYVSLDKKLKVNFESASKNKEETKENPEVEKQTKAKDKKKTQGQAKNKKPRISSQTKKILKDIEQQIFSDNTIEDILEDLDDEDTL
ncbi:ribonuclease J [Mycoplasma sp. Ms02]|uniref:ribonuclease J n=1 Tax=Mycoplasma sp. Ms02 TaxID=353851 RepID=UPI001C894983|nr:ribonuclease J [Mycoplasma sp. Ms02]QZE12368.1 ribonuclease J [Mycoplasma sp. Ms02]